MYMLFFYIALFSVGHTIKCVFEGVDVIFQRCINFKGMCIPMQENIVAMVASAIGDTFPILLTHLENSFAACYLEVQKISKVELFGGGVQKCL